MEVVAVVMQWRAGKASDAAMTARLSPPFCSGSMARGGRVWVSGRATLALSQLCWVEVWVMEGRAGAKEHAVGREREGRWVCASIT